MTAWARPSRTAPVGTMAGRVLLPLPVCLALFLPGCFSVTLPTPASPTPGCNGTIERIRTESLPDAMVGQPYSFRFEHNCSGTSTFVGTSWEASGSLPPGITLGDPWLTNSDRLSGTPTVPGSFSFVVTLWATSFVDGRVVDSKTFSLVVRAAP